MKSRERPIKGGGFLLFCVQTSGASDLTVQDVALSTGTDGSKPGLRLTGEISP